MSARRQVLEDSDDSESEVGGGSSSSSGGAPFKFLTDEQVHEIGECNIKRIGDGTYSADAMELAISQNKVNLVRLEQQEDAQEEDQNDYQGYQVPKDKIDSFLSKPIWKRSGEPSEEVLLLEIETLRRSSKKSKITMFKYNNKTGGKVMFGPWWNYALQRIVQISSDGDDLDWESYTAGRILLSLFAFVTESNDVVKKGKLADLNSTFGVDWDNNIRTAEKVISRYAKDSILDKECTKCKVYVDSLRGDQQPAQASVPTSISLKPSPTDNDEKVKHEDEEKKKRDDEARKKRMAAMKANQRRASALSVSINEQSSRAKSESVTNTPAINPSVTSSTTDSRSRTSSALQSNGKDQMMKPQPPVQSIPSSDPRKQQIQITSNPPPVYSNTPNHTRLETMSNPYESRQSHESYQHHSSTRGAYNQASSNNAIPTPSSDLGDRQYRSREDTNGRYNDRSSDYNRNKDSRYEHSYNRSDSRDNGSSNRNYGRGRDFDDERPRKRPRGSNDYEKSSTNYSSFSAQHNGRGSEKWQPPRESNSSRYESTGPSVGAAFTAPSASGGRGRGRGNVDNRPAWMTQGQKAPGSNSAPPPAQEEKPASTAEAAKETAFSALPASVGRGMGRGRGVSNLPAWMTKGQNNAQSGNSSDLAPDVQQASALATEMKPAFSAPPVSVGRGRGRGRGRGIDNRPAWMSKLES